MKSFCSVPSVIFMTSGIPKTFDRMFEIDVCHFMPDRKLECVVFVFADQVEKASADVDVSAWYRKRIDDVGIENEKLVPDLFAMTAS